MSRHDGQEGQATKAVQGRQMVREARAWGPASKQLDRLLLGERPGPRDNCGR